MLLNPFFQKGHDFLQQVYVHTTNTACGNQEGLKRFLVERTVH